MKGGLDIGLPAAPYLPRRSPRASPPRLVSSSKLSRGILFIFPFFLLRSYARHSPSLLRARSLSLARARKKSYLLLLDESVRPYEIHVRFRRPWPLVI